MKISKTIVLFLIALFLITACSMNFNIPDSANTLGTTLTPLSPTGERVFATPTIVVETPPVLPDSTHKKFILDSQKSVISYAVDETFLNQNNRLSTAIGKTSEISGEIEIDLKNPSQIIFGEFVTDISTLKSDSNRRDTAIQNRWLESAKFPLARFKVNELIGFPDHPVEGVPVEFKLAGELTIKEITRPVTWDVSAELRDNHLLGKASTFIFMADWGIEPPNIAGVLIVKDGVTLNLNFVFVEQ